MCLYSALAGQLELSLYIWCYEKFHIIQLPWDSLGTWFLCVMAVDLMFYIWHRASHGQSWTLGQSGCETSCCHDILNLRSGYMHSIYNNNCRAYLASYSN